MYTGNTGSLIGTLSGLLSTKLNRQLAQEQAAYQNEIARQQLKMQQDAEARRQAAISQYAANARSAMSNGLGVMLQNILDKNLVAMQQGTWTGGGGGGGGGVTMQPTESTPMVSAVDNLTARMAASNPPGVSKDVAYSNMLDQQRMAQEMLSQKQASDVELANIDASAKQGLIDRQLAAQNRLENQAKINAVSDEIQGLNKMLSTPMLDEEKADVTNRLGNLRITLDRLLANSAPTAEQPAQEVPVDNTPEYIKISRGGNVLLETPTAGGGGGQPIGAQQQQAPTRAATADQLTDEERLLLERLKSKYISGYGADSSGSKMQDALLLQRIINRRQK